MGTDAGNPPESAGEPADTLNFADTVSYASELEDWAQLNDDQIVADAIGAIRGALHSLGSSAADSSGETPSPDPDAGSPGNDGTDESAASPVDRMYSEVTDELLCPSKGYQGINNGIEDNNGGSGVCF